MGQYRCNLIVAHGDEEALLEALAPLAVPEEAATPQSTEQAAGKPSLLLFGPPNDPQMVRRLMPRLQEIFVVTHVESVERGMEAIADGSFAACIAKLGTKGNLGVNLISAFR